MESHKQAKATSKKFPGYFREFLLVIIAVGVVFFAEHFWERYTDSKKGKEYIRSFVADLQNDITRIDANLRVRDIRYTQLDSIVELLSSKKVFGYENELYYYGRCSTRDLLFVNCDRTMQRLKNSGGINLIKNSAASDTILAYDNSIQGISYAQKRENDEVKLILPFLAKIYSPYEFEKMVKKDGSIMKPDSNPLLRDSDPEILADFAFYIHEYKTMIMGTASQLRKLRVKAENTIEFLKKEL